MNFPRSMPRVAITLALAGGLAACPPPPPKGTCKDSYPQVALAAQKAAYKIQGKYGSCLPATYNAPTFLTDLQEQGLAEDDLKALRGVGLDVWADSNCEGYVLVAKCNLSTNVLLWDRSSSPSVLDGPGADGAKPVAPVPARTPPASCSCP